MLERLMTGSIAARQRKRLRIGIEPMRTGNVPPLNELLVQVRAELDPSARSFAGFVAGIDPIPDDPFQTELAHRLQNIPREARNSRDRRSGSTTAVSRLSSALRQPDRRQIHKQPTILI